MSRPVTADPAGASGEARDAAATRQALVKHARHRFSQQGYADVTLRDIAADASVSAALVVKYFGSKENLFAEAVSFEQDADLLLDHPLAGLGEHLVRMLLDGHRTNRADPLLRAVFTAVRPAGEQFRDNFERQFVARLAALLPGPGAQLRAELVCAHLIGLAGARLALRTPALAAEPDAAVVARFAPLLQSLIDS